MVHRPHMINYRASDKEKTNLMKLQQHMHCNMSDVLRNVVNLGVDIYEDENLTRLMKKKHATNRRLLINQLVVKELLKYE